MSNGTTGISFELHARAQVKLHEISELSKNMQRTGTIESCTIAFTVIKRVGTTVTKSTRTTTLKFNNRAEFTNKREKIYIRTKTDRTENSFLINTCQLRSIPEGGSAELFM